MATSNHCKTNQKPLIPTPKIITTKSNVQNLYICVYMCEYIYNHYKMLILFHLSSRSCNPLVHLALDGRYLSKIGCRIPFLEKYPQYHEHNGDPEVTLGTCSAVDERAQVIVVWMKFLNIENTSQLKESKSLKG